MAGNSQDRRADTSWDNNQQRAWGDYSQSQEFQQYGNDEYDMQMKVPKANKLMPFSILLQDDTQTPWPPLKIK